MRRTDLNDCKENVSIVSSPLFQFDLRISVICNEVSSSVSIDCFATSCMKRVHNYQQSHLAVINEQAWAVDSDIRKLRVWNGPVLYESMTSLQFFETRSPN